MSTPNGSNVLFKVGDVVKGNLFGNIYRIINTYPDNSYEMIVVETGPQGISPPGRITKLHYSSVKLLKQEASYDNTEWV